jgi:hypothetical protein
MYLLLANHCFLLSSFQRVHLWESLILEARAYTIDHMEGSFGNFLSLGLLKGVPGKINHLNICS